MLLFSHLGGRGTELRVRHPVARALQNPAHCVSIIFVHGLSGGNDTTWKCGTISWPEMLAQEFTHARLLAFEYDPSIWTLPTGMRAMQSASEQLLAQLPLYRRGDVAEHRPIIFIAHSLGGCLVKAVLSPGSRTRVRL
jgi:pimeloyl-ACP methyl ester carboxylesterase